MSPQNAQIISTQASSDSQVDIAMNGAQQLVKALEDQGVEYIFGYPGGAIMPVYDALYDSSLKHILCRHEQGCALAADAYARVVTGIANAYMDSIPMVAITGQVPTSVMGTDAFQEVDIFSMTLAIVKHSYIVRNTDDIPAIVAEAIELAQSGRPGPVLIDLPKNIAAGNIDGKRFIPAVEPSDIPTTNTDKKDALELIRNSKKPLLYIGGGAVMAGVEKELRELASRSGIPAVSTLKGLGVLTKDTEHYLGMLEAG